MVLAQQLFTATAATGHRAEGGPREHVRVRVRPEQSLRFPAEVVRQRCCLFC